MNETDLSQQHYGILDHVPVGVLILKQDNTVLFWNSCLEDWTGIVRNRIVGTDIRSFFPHLDAPKYSGRLSEIFEGGPPTIFSPQIHEYLIPIRLWDGQLQTQYSIITATPALAGSGYYALISIQDVTDLSRRIRDYRIMRDQAMAEVRERKRAEEALLIAQEELETKIGERTADLVSVNARLQTEIAERMKAEEELKKLLSTLDTLVEHIPEGVVLLDADCRIILSNTTGQDFLSALSSAETGDILTHISGMSVEELFLRAQTTVWHEITVTDPMRRMFTVGGSVIGQTESCRGIVLVMKDVTEEKDLQERIYTQERLAAVGQLSAGIAHDFNNILTGIIGFTELILSEDRIGVDDREVMEEIRQNGLRAATLIRQILDFSRKSISEMKPLELSAFLNEFSKFIRRTIPENIYITLVHEPGEYLVRADQTKIQQVLTNLFLNARDAMPHGGKLTFSLSHKMLLPDERPPIPDMTEGEWIVLTLTDTGSGIPHEIMPHIFEPYFTTKESGKGTGLGLSQVYGIVKQHGGFVDVQSEVGSGTSFSISLPVCTAGKISSTPEVPFAVPDGQFKTVLVVEDYEAVRNLIRQILTKLNFTVLTAVNGVDALKIYEKNKASIKLIITDLVMPELGGVEMSRIIKARNPSVKIMAITGYPLGSEWGDLYKAGITECIQKPFEQQTLIQAVCTTLREKAD